MRRDRRRRRRASVAYHLARLGWSDVVLVEQHELTEGTTWHSAGFVGQLRSTISQTRMIMYSSRLYAELANVPAGPGLAGRRRVPPGHHARAGGGARTPGERGTTTGCELDLLSPAEAGERLPLLAVDDVLAAAWLPGDGYLDPEPLAEALAAGRARAGRALRHRHTGDRHRRRRRPGPRRTHRPRPDPRRRGRQRGRGGRRAGRPAGRGRHPDRARSATSTWSPSRSTRPSTRTPDRPRPGPHRLLPRGRRRRAPGRRLLRDPVAWAADGAAGRTADAVRRRTWKFAESWATRAAGSPPWDAALASSTARRRSPPTASSCSARPRSPGSGSRPGSACTGWPPRAASARSSPSGSSTAHRSTTCPRWTSAASGRSAAAAAGPPPRRSTRTRATTTSSTPARSGRPAGRCAARRPGRGWPSSARGSARRRAGSGPTGSRSNTDGDGAARPRGWAGRSGRPPSAPSAAPPATRPACSTSRRSASSTCAARARSPSLSGCAPTTSTSRSAASSTRSCSTPAAGSRPTSPSPASPRTPSGWSPARRSGAATSRGSAGTCRRRRDGRRRRHRGAGLPVPVGSGGARDPPAAGRRRPVARGVRLPAARESRRRRAGPRAADHVRRRAGLGALLPGRVRPGAVGRALGGRARRTGCAPAATARSTRCAWRRATASGAPTSRRRRRPTEAGLGFAVRIDKPGGSSGATRCSPPARPAARPRRCAAWSSTTRWRSASATSRSASTASRAAASPPAATGTASSRSIAYAYLPAAVEPGDRVEVAVFGRWIGADVAREPLYDPGNDRVRGTAPASRGRRGHAPHMLSVHHMKMLQVRNVPEDVHRALKERAAREGTTMSELVLRELPRLATRPSPEQVLARSQACCGRR